MSGLGNSERLINQGIVDSGNSSEVPLTSGSTFTGSWFNTTKYSQLTTFVNVDESGTLYLDMSTNGSDTDKTITVSVTSPGISKTLVVVTKFMRVRYTNGGTNQGTFRLQTMFHKYKSRPLSSALDDTIVDSEDALITRSVISGKNPSGNYVNVPVDANSYLYTAVGLVDSTNSTTTPLTGSNVYTGSWIDCTQYKTMSVIISTDQSGTLDIELSSDGTNVDKTVQTAITSPGGDDLVTIISQYMRVKYTNGGVDQGHFRLQTNFKK